MNQTNNLPEENPTRNLQKKQQGWYTYSSIRELQ
jgi:hypothetical protein